ncbi:MAG: peptidase C25, partial [Bacteroidota bacterium]
YKFVAGSITNENPDLLGIMFDENGINTVGNGIGHDLVAVLDENTEKSIVLNDFYQADLNSYQSGIVRYPFNKLSEGRHTLSLKAWDVYNNSNTATTDFVVASSANLALQHVLNYPNPFTTFTKFMFEHNKPCETLDVSIQIFTVSGKLVKTLETIVKCEGFRSEQIIWDGLDDFGDRIGRGVYVYRLKVTAADGTWADKYEKLVVLK